ncbi:MAG: hypothetical protein IPJ61_21445 [Tessaracoccus sp.]|uniref:hypothetical protein n=1 Tax=Tessaracoccus sp. TaxID=1971211 RepID=UPI001ED478B4|nr:hypothetical protein [Tessaracoccus sp.]MBK7823554.1 hypothetical protein [Tessaracoccus sp.]
MSDGYELRGQRYPFGYLEKAVLGDQIKVERWLRESGLSEARTWDDLLAIAKEINGLPDLKEQRQHPEFRLTLVIGIWLARRQSGEDVWPADCLDYTFDELEFYGENEDDEGKDVAAK